METNYNVIMQMYTDMYTIVKLEDNGIRYRIKVTRSKKLLSTNYFQNEDEARDYFKQIVVSHFSMHILHAQGIINHISEEIHIVQYHALTANNLEDVYNSVCDPKFAKILRNLKEELSDWLGTILNWGIEGKNSLDTTEKGE